MDSLRIGTWNILGRRRACTKDTVEDGAVSALLTNNPVDVLCLQEVHFYEGRPDAQVVGELRAAGLRYAVWLPLSESHLDSSAHLGIGIVARDRVYLVDRFRLSNPELKAIVRGQEWVLHDKGMVGATIRRNGRQISVFSLHLFPFHEFGVADDDECVEDMWREFWEHVDTVATDADAVLAGDFNQIKRKDVAERFSRREWQFCVGDTVTTSFGLSLDEIALSWSPSSSSSRSIPTFSDHHLAIAEIG
jgi:exonuclease III